MVEFLMKEKMPDNPILNVLSRANGIFIEDLEGKQYIDMHDNAVHNAGFNSPAVIAAVKKQLKWL